MSILEDKIRKNREHYNVHEPEAGHAERFAAMLDAEFHAKSKPNRFRILRYAAAILLIAGVSTVLLYQYAGNSSSVNAHPMAAELNNVVEHYNNLADKKLVEISNCAASDVEAAKINELAKTQLEKLEKDASSLQQELDKDNSNNRVYGALVNNYRTRIKILDNIIYQICQL